MKVGYSTSDDNEIHVIDNVDDIQLQSFHSIDSPFSSVIRVMKGRQELQIYLDKEAKDLLRIRLS